jgi:tRNA-Thr(GGU) m(6)t(6)A37 methyltransferase TsaA
MEIKIEPLAFVKNTRQAATDDFWGDVISEITLADHVPDIVFQGLSEFSHLDIIYYFDKVDKSKIVNSGRPRGNPDFPEVGIFAQRKKDRPNMLGLCTVQLVEVKGRSLRVKLLDAIDGTPVLDIKPTFREFLPRGPVRQPTWVEKLMRDYWTQDNHA